MASSIVMDRDSDSPVGYVHINKGKGLTSRLTIRVNPKEYSMLCLIAEGESRGLAETVRLLLTIGINWWRTHREINGEGP